VLGVLVSLLVLGVLVSLLVLGAVLVSLPVLGALMVEDEELESLLVAGDPPLALELSLSAACKPSGAANAAATARTNSFLSFIALPLRKCARNCASVEGASFVPRR